MKKVFFFLSVLFLLSSSLPVSAAEKNEDSTTCKPVVSKETQDSMAKYKEDDASIVESYTIDLITSVVNFADINTLANLIFGNPYCIWSDEENTKLVNGVFTIDEQTKIIDPMVKMLKSTFSLILVLTFLYSSIKLAFSGLNGRARANFWEETKTWFIIAFFLATHDIFIEYLFILNDGILKGLKEFLLSNGLDYTSFSLMTSKTEIVFTDIIVFFAEWVLALYLNVIYIYRKIMIIFLLLLTPLAGMSLLSSRLKHFFSTWVRDLCGLVFLQSFHGVILTVFILLSSMVSGIDETGVIYKMTLLILFIPLTGMLTSWFNLSEANSNLDKMGMFGVQSAAVAVNLTKSIRRLPSAKSGPINLAEQSRTKLSERAQGINSKGWNSAKKVMSGTGAFIGGTAGLVLGPQGAILGSQIGKGVTGGVLQGSRNISSFTLNARDTLKGIKENGGLKNTFNDIGKRRAMFGDVGESVGSLIGRGGTGRHIGHAFSGGSRQRLLNSSELGGFAGVNLESLKEISPDSNYKWIQDNKGSALYMQQGEDQWNRVSPLGAADSSMGTGMQREVNLAFKPAGPSLQANPDGGYSLSQISDRNNLTLTPTSEAMIRTPQGTLQDSSFPKEQMDLNSYYKPGLQGSDMRTHGDKFADTLHSIFENNHSIRHRGFS
ncbi:hypothetical protein [Bacillus infantis]|uniref:hypothetical protein n=1 Tax=Bacillus infantis TaxID=324767 RepID=UPI00209D9ADC|nr:hypothetical protein [Bacillus infantis]MCP1161367.1 hypothetical protein [Bacillus infantis]